MFFGGDASVVVEKDAAVGGRTNLCAMSLSIRRASPSERGSARNAHRRVPHAQKKAFFCASSSSADASLSAPTLPFEGHPSVSRMDATISTTGPARFKRETSLGAASSATEISFFSSRNASSSRRASRCSPVFAARGFFASGPGSNAKLKHAWTSSILVSRRIAARFVPAPGNRDAGAAASRENPLRSRRRHSRYNAHDSGAPSPARSQKSRHSTSGPDSARLASRARVNHGEQARAPAGTSEGAGQRHTTVESSPSPTCTSPRVSATGDSRAVDLTASLLARRWVRRLAGGPARRSSAGISRDARAPQCAPSRVSRGAREPRAAVTPPAEGAGDLLALQPMVAVGSRDDVVVARLDVCERRRRRGDSGSRGVAERAPRGYERRDRTRDAVNLRDHPPCANAVDARLRVRRRAREARSRTRRLPRRQRLSTCARRRTRSALPRKRRARPSFLCDATAHPRTNLDVFSVFPRRFLRFDATPRRDFF